MAPGAGLDAPKHGGRQRPALRGVARDQSGVEASAGWSGGNFAKTGGQFLPGGCAVGPGLGKQHFDHILMSWEAYSDTPRFCAYVYVYIYIYRQCLT